LFIISILGIEVVGDLERTSDTRPDHFVKIFVDDKEVAKSEKKPCVPSPRWEWPEDHELRVYILIVIEPALMNCLLDISLLHPSSTIKIIIYRQSRVRIRKYIVGQHSGKVFELLENGLHISTSTAVES
jgi:hypothetical protein